MPGWDLSASCHISFNCLLIAPSIGLHLPMKAFEGVSWDEDPHRCPCPGKQPRCWHWDGCCSRVGRAPRTFSDISGHAGDGFFAQPGPFLMSGTSDLPFLVSQLPLACAVSPDWVCAALQTQWIVPSRVTPRGPPCHISVSLLVWRALMENP